MKIGVTEIILILILALVLFGGKKLAGVGKAMGQSIREFKNEVAPEDKTPENKEEHEA
ncbi:MAG: twin-arginine translocase TatA/TatE family subunit [Clostridiales bacterium]|nr:twin-arginine translocase TatA/TatE family subunit [Clostridiales bacterium]